MSLDILLKIHFCILQGYQNDEKSEVELRQQLHPYIDHVFDEVLLVIVDWPAAHHF